MEEESNNSSLLQTFPRNISEQEARDGGGMKETQGRENRFYDRHLYRPCEEEEEGGNGVRWENFSSLSPPYVRSHKLCDLTSFLRNVLPPFTLSSLPNFCGLPFAGDVTADVCRTSCYSPLPSSTISVKTHEKVHFK